MLLALLFMHTSKPQGKQDKSWKVLAEAEAKRTKKYGLHR